MPRKPLHLIYITGLGDHKVNGQLKAVRLWNRYGVSAEVFQVKWADREPWQPKFERLLKLIDQHIAEGKHVALVGASAGASAVINAYAARKDQVVGTVLLAGKVNRAHAIGGSYRSQNPAFITSAEASQYALKTLGPEHRRRTQSRYGIIDEIVPFTDSVIKGARNKVMPTIGHIPTIALQIIFPWGFIHFLKRQARQLESSTI
jgi:hypothetical protein